MTQTSLLSYQDLQPVIGLRQAAVFDALRRLGGTGTDRQVSDLTAMPRALVAARRKELVDSGLVEPAEETYDSVTNRTVMKWRVR